MKFFLGLLAAVLLFVVGVVVGRLSTLTINLPELPDVTPVMDAIESELTGEEASQDATTTPATESGAVEPSPTPGAAAPAQSSEAFRFSVASLPPTQQAILRTFGVEGTEIVISNQMFSCMQAKISAERLVEIKSGTAPSFTEAVTLVGCYTGN